MKSTRVTALLCAALLLGVGVAAVGIPEAGDSFRVNVLLHKNGMLAIRYCEASGRTWLRLGDEWIEVPESEKLEPGRYQLETSLTPDAERWVALRVNVRNGRVWQLGTKQPDTAFWTEIIDAAKSP